MRDPDFLLELWASRNGELHVLCRKLLDRLRESCPDDPLVWEAEKELTNVPQVRLNAPK
jgi:hypothetical protein